MNEIRLKRKTLAAEFHFSSFSKGLAKENNFLSMQASPWPMERCMLELEMKKGQRNYRLISFNWVKLGSSFRHMRRKEIGMDCLEKEEGDPYSLGFSKVFSMVLCSILVVKMEIHGLDYIQVDYKLWENWLYWWALKDSGQWLKFN